MLFWILHEVDPCKPIEIIYNHQPQLPQKGGAVSFPHLANSTSHLSYLLNFVQFCSTRFCPHTPLDVVFLKSLITRRDKKICANPEVQQVQIIMEKLDSQWDPEPTPSSGWDPQPTIERTSMSEIFAIPVLKLKKQSLLTVWFADLKWASMAYKSHNPVRL